MFVTGTFKNDIVIDEETIVTGRSDDDVFIAKFNEASNLSWIRSFGSENPDFIYDIILKNDSLLLVGAFTGIIKFSSTDSIASYNSYDGYLISYSINGEFQLAKNIIQGPSLEVIKSIDMDRDDNVLLTGYYSDSAYFQNDTLATNGFTTNFYSKFDKDFNLVWTKHILGKDNFCRIENVLYHENAYYYSGYYKDSMFFSIDTLSPTGDNTDVFIGKTNTNGNFEWLRRIKGEDGFEYSSLSIIDDLGDLYVFGKTNSSSIAIDSMSPDDGHVVTHNTFGGYDIFVSKYSGSGIYQNSMVFGGTGDDGILGNYLFEDKIYMSGFYSGELNWNNNVYSSNGTLDKEAFFLQIDTTLNNPNTFITYDGDNNYYDAGVSNVILNENTSFKFGVFNSSYIQFRDTTYENESNNRLAYLVKYDCPLDLITIHSQTPTDINCFGETGGLTVDANGGFSSYLLFSVDSGDTYHQNSGVFEDLPAGEYDVLVKDSTGCTVAGGSYTLEEPGELDISVVSSSDITNDADGEIEVEGSGGTTPYTFTLQPGGTSQENGTFTLTEGEGGDYTVELDDANNCGPVVTGTITIQDFVGFDELELNDAVVYPNPSDGIVTIEFATEQDEVTLEIYSLNGQQVMQKTVRPTGGMVSETLSLETLDAGTYLLKAGNAILSEGIVVK